MARAYKSRSASECPPGDSSSPWKSSSKHRRDSQSSSAPREPVRRLCWIALQDWPGPTPGASPSATASGSTPPTAAIFPSPSGVWDTCSRPSASTILQAFRIPHLAARYPREISGGESQRTALARTLVTDPALLLLDEPLAALDASTKTAIIDDLRSWNQAHRIPILYVTHSREEVFALGERVIVLDSGRIVAQGTPHEVISAPLQETVAQLVGFENIFDAIVESVHPERGTMSCRIESDAGPVVLETPLVRGGVGSALRVGIRAGDILLATAPPVGLSARNVIPGRIKALIQRDVIVTAHVKCRVEMEVHLTLAARDSLQLVPGREVWLVIKTHSCHLMRS